MVRSFASLKYLGNLVTQLSKMTYLQRIGMVFIEYETRASVLECESASLGDG